MIMSLSVYAFLLLALSSWYSADATLGLDVSTLVYPKDFECLKNAGYDFLIVRGYRSYGSPDPDAIHTIANARQAGFKYIDVYMFPCPKCAKSASAQVDEMVKALNISYGQIWLDIEFIACHTQGSQYWRGSYSENQKFFEELLSAASGHKPTGVYASESQWDEIMGGNSYTGGSSHQLWYAHYDSNPSFSDFRSFGGWSRPAMKQYEGDRTECGVGVDLNYY